MELRLHHLLQPDRDHGLRDPVRDSHRWREVAARGHPGEISPRVPAAPALVVVLHGCTQSADDYLAHSGWRELADRDGFVLVLPQQKIANNLNRCFNWFEENDIRRGSVDAADRRTAWIPRGYSSPGCPPVGP